MNIFCTIITADFFPRALALYKSIVTYDKNIDFYVLVSDNKPVDTVAKEFPHIQLVPVSNLENYPLVRKLHSKYAHINMDFFRWSLKPVWISYLLEQGAEKILYLDADMFFVNDYHFLFDELDNSSILLTPHWRNNDPLIDSASFYSLFRSGIFTAGFIGVNRNAIPALQWWAEACHFQMGEHPSLGIHDDQRYLDIFPIYFEGCKIIRHRGCTIGAWHYEQCKRILVDGQVLINGIYPVIFIHFEDMLVSQILKGHDALLLPYLNRYKQVFEENGYSLSDYIHSVETYANITALKRFKWNSKLRTRFKAFLYRLAQSV